MIRHKEFVCIFQLNLYPLESFRINSVQTDTGLSNIESSQYKIDYLPALDLDCIDSNNQVHLDIQH